jgi:hypothetical protein
LIECSLIIEEVVFRTRPTRSDDGEEHIKVSILLSYATMMFDRRQRRFFAWLGRLNVGVGSGRTLGLAFPNKREGLGFAGLPPSNPTEEKNKLWGVSVVDRRAS